ncbi:MAG: hypothetical protein KJ757_02400 [Planctomycetes bacterium]|nr:hypothetical protein [Planctomycetota bacterium]MBU1517763.1 hypothetical protein [Planctomycetota bacterium]MBU2458382.1 hypothetical protein [Planctomycetota bacterium]MBU2596402.1 hypothetical protein [Planctomycetota bacterium]
MKKTVLLPAILVVLAITSFYASASSQSSEPNLLRIDIVGPNSVLEDTQNVFCVVAVYDDGSEIEVTADADVKVVSDECKVTNLGGIVETFKLKQPEKQFTIHASYRGLEAEKPVAIYCYKKKHCIK